MKKVKFNQSWSYFKGSGSSLGNSIRGDADTKAFITLPHDTSIGMPRNPQEENGSGNGYFHEETGHYVKEFTLTQENRGKSIWLEFEGVYQNAFVYINNAFAGKCPYGYSNFFLDISQLVKFEEPNLIKVVVKNGVPSGRWYTGGGIYRDVNLMIADRLHFAPEGIHLTTLHTEGEKACIQSEAQVVYRGIGVRNVELRLQLLDADGKIAAENRMPFTVMEQTNAVYRQMLYVDNAMLWDMDQPYLYSYKIQLVENEEILDEEEGTFGIRTLGLDPYKGFTVNGKIVKLRGGCIHHDNGILGSAEFKHAETVRIRKLKAAGYNAVRSAHHPMSRILLDVCDQEGMLVMDEYADVWTSTKVDFDYGMAMTEWWEHDITNMIQKDYNHPCVVMYSIGNEIRGAGNQFDAQWGKKLTDKIRSLDKTRYVINSLNLMFCIGDRFHEVLEDLKAKKDIKAGAAAELVQKEDLEINNLMTDLGTLMDTMINSELAGKVTEEAAAQVDIVGYNYGTSRYEPDMDKYAQRILLGSETYGRDLDVNWELVEKHPRILGDFSWTAWDYLGESGIGKISYGERPGGIYADYPYKLGNCGDFNILGDRQPISYWREILWGFRKKPYLSVQPPAYHGVDKFMSRWSMSDAVRCWNWTGYEGKPVTVEVYALAEKAVLYCNGKLVEEKHIGETKKGVVLFETTYEPGRLEVITYNGDKEWGRDEIQTASEQVRIIAEADITKLPADGSDIGYVEIYLKDEAGNLNPMNKKPVKISIEGPGELAGYGSADPESEECFLAAEAVPFYGRLKAAVRGTGQPGIITVTLCGEDLQPVHLQIEAV